MQIAALPAPVSVSVDLIANAKIRAFSSGSGQESAPSFEG